MRNRFLFGSKRQGAGFQCWRNRFLLIRRVNPFKDKVKRFLKIYFVFFKDRLTMAFPLDSASA